MLPEEQVLLEVAQKQKFQDHYMENMDLATKGNKYRWQKENINQSENIKLHLAGYDLDTSPSNF